VVYGLPIGYFLLVLATEPITQSVLNSSAGFALLMFYVVIGIGQFAFWGVIYWWRFDRQAGWWRGVGWGLGYVAYIWLFYLTCCRAAIRIFRGRSGWAKTRRNAERRVAGPTAKEA
jgi:hypothetical protein